MTVSKEKAPKRQLILSHLAKWENENGTLCAITPDEWMALMEPIANLAMLESPRQAIRQFIEQSQDSGHAAAPTDTLIQAARALDLAITCGEFPQGGGVLHDLRSALEACRAGSRALAAPAPTQHWPILLAILRPAIATGQQAVIQHAQRLVEVLTGDERAALVKLLECPRPTEPPARVVHGSAPTPQPELTDERMPSPKVRPLSLEESLSGAQVCCTDYASCHRACTPRGRWQASQAIQEIEREFVAVDDLPAFIRRLQDEVREVRSLLGAAPKPQPGWKLVPVEPTPEMIAAMALTPATMMDDGVPCIGMGGAEEAYAAMLGAAPTQAPQQGCCHRNRPDAPHSRWCPVHGEGAAQAPQQPVAAGVQAPWIPTSERLPEIGDRVLIFSTSPATGNSRIHLAWRLIPYEEATTWWWETSHFPPSHPVVPEFTSHWMPLPTPPRVPSSDGGQSNG